MNDRDPSAGRPVRDRLAAELRGAMKRRDIAAVAALRSALAEIANAEAIPVPADAAPATTSQHVAGASAGLGSAEAKRRALTEAEVIDIVVREADERELAAARHDEIGRGERADRLRAEAGVLRSVVGGSVGGST